MTSLDDFKPLRPAERRLVDWLQAGNRAPCVLSAGLPSVQAPEALRLRASFVSHLARGGCAQCPLPETGLRIFGAVIEGDGPPGAETRGLDLDGARLPGDLVFVSCRIPELVLLRSARVENLFFNGSALRAGLAADRLHAYGDVVLDEVATGAAADPGRPRAAPAETGAGKSGDALFVDRLEARGSVFLDGEAACGEVRLLGARLGGDLSCTRARFAPGPQERAFSADRIDVKGDIFLSGAAIEGELRLLGAQLGGDLNCYGTRMSARGARWALHAQGARIAGSFVLRGGASVDGMMNLTRAEIGAMTDLACSWPAPGNMLLNRCRYGGFTGPGTPITAEARIDWLSRQDGSLRGGDFWSQPWEECARVLREMGHDSEARAVLIEKERRQRAARRARLRRQYLYEDADWYALWDRFLGATVRYGRQPLLALAWLVAPWLMGSLIFGGAVAQDAVKPNLPQIQRAQEWVLCGEAVGVPVPTALSEAPAVGRRMPDQTRIECFHAQPEGATHPRFDAMIYSADTLLPVVSLEMQSYWIPDDAETAGSWARAYLWLHIALDWFLTILAAAGLSGLIRTDNTT